MKVVAEELASRECSEKRDESVEWYGKSVTDSRTFYVDIRAAWGSCWAAFAPAVAQERTWQMCQMCQMWSLWRAAKCNTPALVKCQPAFVPGTYPTWQTCIGETVLHHHGNHHKEGGVDHTDTPLCVRVRPRRVSLLTNTWKLVQMSVACITIIVVFTSFPAIEAVRPVNPGRLHAGIQTQRIRLVDPAVVSCQ
jgi:hypothetical protein